MPPLSTFEKTMPAILVSRGVGTCRRRRVRYESRRIRKFTQTTQAKAKRRERRQVVFVERTRGRENEDSSPYDTAYDRALACVDSRSNFLRDGSLSLTPVLDMINHSPLVGTSAAVAETSTDDDERTQRKKERRLRLDVETQSLLRLPNGGPVTAALPREKKNFFSDLFAMSPNRKQQQNDVDNAYNVDEVRCSYGDLTNLQTLVDYGFVADDNPCNRERFAVKLLGSSPSSLASRTPSPQVVTVAAQSVGSIDFASVSLIRRALATPEELRDNNIAAAAAAAPIPPQQRQRQPRRSSPLLVSVPKLSDRNEMETWGLIAGYLQDAVDDCRSCCFFGGGGESAPGPPVSENDDLIRRCLLNREALLRTALRRIQRDRPELFF